MEVLPSQLSCLCTLEPRACRNNQHRQKFKHSLTLLCKIQKPGEPLFSPVLTRPSAASPPAQWGHCSPRPAAGCVGIRCKWGEKGFAPQAWSQGCQPLPRSSGSSWVGVTCVGIALSWASSSLSSCHRSFPSSQRREKDWSLFSWKFQSN